LSTAHSLNSKQLQTEVQDGVGIITFNQPNSPVSEVENAC